MANLTLPLSQAFSRAVAAYNAGKLVEAEQLCQQIIRAKPALFDALHLLGVVQASLGKQDLALASYDRALTVRPDHAEALSNRGLTLHELKRYEEALAGYESALTARPGYAKALSNRGVTLQELNRYEEALASYDRALTVRPDYAEALSNRGNTLHELRRYEEALASYDRALTVRPDLAEALFNRGNTLKELKRYEEALASYDRALAVRPDHAGTLSNRGITLHELKRYEEALASYDRALIVRADYAEALYNRGLTLHELKRYEEALASYDRALTAGPDYAEALLNRGATLHELKRYEEALASYDRALTVWPDYAEARYNRGVTLQELKRYEEALGSYDRALSVRPDYAEALLNRGNTLQELTRYEEALVSYDRALIVRPDWPVALTSRGLTLHELKRFEEALASYESVLAVRPDYAEALSNRGNILQELKRFEEALASYESALTVRPDHAETHWNEGLLRLLTGDFSRGWGKFEWRWEIKDFPSKRPNIAPPWRGEDLTGRHVVIFSEQGLGDVVQFARYLPLLVERKAKITFLTDEKLIRLLRPLGAQIKIASGLEGKEVFDFQCALMSLPHWFKTDLSSIPNKVPYLAAEEELSHRWKERIGENGFKIGIAWQGNPEAKIDQGRSIPLEEFIPLTRLPGVRLISLQKHHGLDQLTRLPADAKIETLGDDLDSGPDAFIDTAAVMHNLDLIITSDTSIAHLAGALGRPTWVALKYIPDYRWMLDRDDSPWYPTMRLFRQQDRDNWQPVFRQIEEQLQSLLGRWSIHAQPPVEPSPKVAVSWGELLDKITILEIKLQRIKSEKAIASVRHELDALLAAAVDIEAKYPHLAFLKKELRSVNEALWDIEDGIRGKEASKSFDQEFIDLARSVYIQNDRRGHLKREINRLVNSEFVEEKQYTAYNPASPDDALI